ncbi:MAG: VOC family protein [Planctomycetales bacterium]|nr:VOC family protein [Planctomycetales bacterium]
MARIRHIGAMNQPQLTHQSLNHVTIVVQDLEKSTRFYEDVLLLKAIPRPAFSFPGAWFRLGIDQELHLIGGRTEPVYSNVRGNHFALMIEDMDAWEQHFRTIGVDYAPRRTRPDGAFQIYVTDPDGFFIELCTAP